MMEMMRNLRYLLSPSLCANRPVARRCGVLVSAGEFQLQALRWSAAFAALPRPRVALYFDDSIDFAAALFGAWNAGKTVILPGELTYPILQALAKQVEVLASDQPVPAMQMTLVGPAEVPADPPAEPLDPEQAWLEVFTSGSTGGPTAIPKKLRQLFAEIDTLESAFGRTAGTAEVLGLVSHQHIYGLLFRILWPLASGRILHAERLPYVETLLQQLDDGMHAVVIASPAHLKRLPDRPLCDATRVAAVFSSSGPLPQEALRPCERLLGQTPIEIYGSSETGGIAWRQRCTAALDKAMEWTVLPGICWRAAEDGRLQLRSPHMPAPGEWYDSEDRVREIGQGFDLLGRIDRLLKIEGKRVSVLALEQALLQTGLLLEARVFALEDGGREQLAVVAQPNADGWSMLENEGKAGIVHRLRAHMTSVVDRVALPRRWRFVSQLPSNAQGKSTLSALRALFDPRRPAVRVLQRGLGEVLLQLEVNASLPQFQGHFAQQPILPGVAQLDWVMLFGREFLPVKNSFVGIDGLKFQQVIEPNSVVELHLSFKAPLLSFVYRSSGGQHACGKIRFEAAQ